MHRLSASFVLGYHGCDQSVADRLISGEKFKQSENDYDWLGHGVYFWESNPLRGLEWAQRLSRDPKSDVKTPAVVGAIVDLAHCLDLSTTGSVRQVEDAYQYLENTFKAAKALTKMPKNSKDLMARRLDCAVLNMLHDVRAQNKLTPVDTVRGVFVEGDPIYPNAGMHVDTHIQICVRNPECIHGVFKVPDHDLPA